MLGWASYWTDHAEQTIELIERAYAAYLAEGDLAGASTVFDSVLQSSELLATGTESRPIRDRFEEERKFDIVIPARFLP